MDEQREEDLDKEAEEGLHEQTGNDLDRQAEEGLDEDFDGDAAEDFDEKSEEGSAEDLEENADTDGAESSDSDESDEWDDDFGIEEEVEGSSDPNTPFPSEKPAVTASAAKRDIKSKVPKVATSFMVVMFLQAVLETSRAAIRGPENAYLEWTFLPQTLELNSSIANCKDENSGSLHRKQEARTAGAQLKWGDINPLEYISIGVRHPFLLQVSAQTKC